MSVQQVKDQFLGALAESFDAWLLRQPARKIRLRLKEQADIAGLVCLIIATLQLGKEIRGRDFLRDNPIFNHEGLANIFKEYGPIAVTRNEIKFFWRTISEVVPEVHFYGIKITVEK